MIKFDNSWDELLKDEFEKEYYLRIRDFLKKEYSTKTIFPDMYKIFEALKLTPYEDVKVVILGQDPYHGVNQAHGLAFSVLEKVPPPPSLVNIFKELHDDLGCYIPNNGFLEKWARQGVLLLNSSLTVVKDHANSHKNIGWNIFTDKIIELINKKDDAVVYMLWGNDAKNKETILNNSKHLILKSVHPSPLSASRGFFGCRHFSKANDFLSATNKTPIDWQIENI